MNTNTITIAALKNFINGELDIEITNEKGRAFTVDRLTSLLNKDDEKTVEVTVLDADDDKEAGAGLLAVHLYCKTVLVNGLGVPMYIEKKKLVVTINDDGEKETKKHYYRCFGKKGKSRALMSGAMTRICQESGVSDNEIIQISFAELLADEELGREIAELRTRRSIKNGIVIKYGKPYFIIAKDGDDGKMHPDRLASLYGDSVISFDLMRDKIFVPGWYTSSGRMDGKLIFIRNDKVEAWQTAANGCTSFQLQKTCVSRWMRDMKKALFAVTAKVFKYSGLALGAKEELDEIGFDDNAHIVVVDKDVYAISDGGISATTKCGLKPGMYQTRLCDTSAKGDMDVNNALFAALVSLMKETGVDIFDLSRPGVRHFGDTTKPVSILMDTNSWKHDPFRHDGQHHWLVKKFLTKPNMASLSESALLKLQRVYDIDLSGEVYVAYKRIATQRFWEAIHPAPNSGFVVQMLAGLDNGSTLTSLSLAHKSMIPDDGNGKYAPIIGAGFDGWVIPIASSHVFDAREADAMAARKINPESVEDYIVFAHPDTMKIIGRELMGIRYPETGENNKPHLHVVADERCSLGVVYFAENERTEAVKAVLTGCDFDGDKICAFTVKKANGSLTILGKAINGREWVCDAIINDFSDIAESTTLAADTAKAKIYMEEDNSFMADTFCLDCGQVGSAVTYDNIVKLSAANYHVDCKDAIDYDWNWSWEKSIFCKKVLHTAEIREWMEYVGNFGHNILLRKHVLRKWRRDVGIIGNWLAECATAISSSGYGIPRDILDFFRIFAKDITNRAKFAEKDRVDAYNAVNRVPIKARTLAELQRDLSIGEDFSIRHAAEMAIADAYDWIYSVCGLKAREPRLAKSKKDYLTSIGFFNVTSVAGENPSVPVWDYFNGGLMLNKKIGTLINGVSVNDFADIAYEGGYASRVLPAKALANSGYRKEDIMKVLDPDDYRDRAVMTFFVGRKLDENGKEVSSNSKYDHLIDLLNGDEKAIADGYGVNSIVIDGINENKRATICLNKTTVTLDRAFTNKLTGPTMGKWMLRDGGAYLACKYDTSHNERRYCYVVLLDRDLSANNETSDK